MTVTRTTLDHHNSETLPAESRSADSSADSSEQITDSNTLVRNQSNRLAALTRCEAQELLAFITVETRMAEEKRLQHTWISAVGHYNAALIRSVKELPHVSLIRMAIQQAAMDSRSQYWQDLSKARPSEQLETLLDELSHRGFGDVVQRYEDNRLSLQLAPDMALYDAWSSHLVREDSNTRPPAYLGLPLAYTIAQQEASLLCSQGSYADANRTFLLDYVTLVASLYVEETGFRRSDCRCPNEQAIVTALGAASAVTYAEWAHLQNKWEHLTTEGKTALARGLGQGFSPKTVFDGLVFAAHDIWKRAGVSRAHSIQRMWENWRHTIDAGWEALRRRPQAEGIPVGQRWDRCVVESGGASAGHHACSLDNSLSKAAVPASREIPQAHRLMPHASAAAFAR